MDLWEPNPNRHKRSYTDMSHSATLSPSPINFGDPATSSFLTGPNFTLAASENIPPYFEPRRISHPHNHYSQRASEEMSDRPQSQLRPRLVHRASQTVIDLTNDSDDAPVASRIGADASRSQRPPQLGRSDAINIEDLIDLTDDGADAVEIVHSRTTARRQLHSNLRPPARRREESPPLFMPRLPPPPRLAHVQPPAAAAGRPVEPQRHLLGGLIEAHARAYGGFGLGNGNFPAMHQRGLDFMQQLQQHGGAFQPMPGNMNYGPAWQNQKLVFEAPPAARDNFTRSPVETDTVICPSCEDELVHDKEAEEPLKKKGGRAPSRKDREEHPFWVVKECGHVYCNSCYQRRNDAKKHPEIAFEEFSGPGKKKTLRCAVDDCEVDVKAKDKWVGVFL